MTNHYIPVKPSDKHTLIAILGESGSGKTSLANYLEDNYGWSVLKSYTTRDKRSDSKDDHTYVTQEEFDLIEDKVATNYYTGSNAWYCATKKQCDESDIYVVDIPGLEQLRKNYTNKHIFAIYLEVDKDTRVSRMKQRGDNLQSIQRRIVKDCQEFAMAKDICDVTICNNSSLVITAMQVDAVLKNFYEKLLND
ncbi:MAG: AAA family ATPase [Anaerostipes sp.]|uniref:AAA family ATPase n=1 Tax=Anaerostipes sp. TaxID=1872530 RepID=UPI00399372AD